MANKQRYTGLINEYLDKTTTVLISYLNKILPRISSNWWRKTVIEKLTDIQIKTIKRKKIENLAGLDLAALLRIFDMNWNEISQQYNLLYEDRNILKEMQAVRNRWSHIPKTGYSLKRIHRDFDTIQFFCELIEAPKKIINELLKIKLDIMQEINIESGNGIKPTIPKVKNNAPKWSGYYFVNTGISDDPDRDWKLNIKYKYISGGNKKVHITQMQKLKKGDKIFAYFSGNGYVGYGIVEEAAVFVTEYFVDGKKMVDGEDFNDHKWKNANDRNKDEWIVKVKWIKVFNENAAKWKKGLIAYRTTVCKIIYKTKPDKKGDKAKKTVDYLCKEFGIK